MRKGNRNERERDAEGRENGVYIHMGAFFSPFSAKAR